MTEPARTSEAQSEGADDVETDGPEPKTEAGAEHPRPEIVDRLLARRDRHRKRSKPYRVVWVVAAVVIVLFGVLITPLPGPGPLVLIPAGLAMLALEFEWAERLLEWALVQANRATSSLSRGAKIAVILVGVTAVVALLLAMYQFDIPVLPDR